LTCAEDKQACSIPGDMSEDAFSSVLCLLLAAEFMLWELWNFSSLGCTGDPRLLTYFAYSSGIHFFLTGQFE